MTIFIQLLSDANGIGYENEGDRKRMKQFMAQFCTFLIFSSLCMRFLPLSGCSPCSSSSPTSLFAEKEVLRLGGGGGMGKGKERGLRRRSGGKGC